MVFFSDSKGKHVWNASCLINAMQVLGLKDAQN